MIYGDLPFPFGLDARSLAKGNLHSFLWSILERPMSPLLSAQGGVKKALGFRLWALAKQGSRLEKQALGFRL
jgi:hypothetical protein